MLSRDAAFFESSRIRLTVIMAMESRGKNI